MKGRKILSRLALAALVAGCGLALANAAPDPSPPAEKPPVDPGLALIQARCVACHDLGFVLQARRPAPEWRVILNQMVGRGAELTESEADQVQAYLEENVAPVPPAP